MYRDVPSKVSFPKMEEKILEFWEEKNIFKKSVEQRNQAEDYVFYDGPPGTNGYPHIGHMLQSTLKDLWPRYKTMKGYRVIRKAGWDTHGLPIELTAEKELNLSSKKDIEGYGIQKFMDYCRDTVFRYKKDWVNAIQRVGRFLDFEDEYATLTNDFIQCDWWVLKQAWDKGLLYKGHKVIAYCPRLGTTLSNHEVAQGYRDVVDITIFAKFPLKDEKNTYFIAWTTTAWTLLGNVALALGKDIDYVKIQVADEYYILAKERLKPLEEKGFLKDYKIIQSYKGGELEGIEYIPLWDFFSHLPDKQHYTINDDYVTTENGSGIVHLALYGEDDYRLIHKNSLPFVQHVDLNGLFTKECGDYAHRSFDEEGMDIAILKDLSSRNLVFAKEKLKHSYPFNYRTGTRLIYYAKSSWFLKTTAIKEAMIKANQDVNWYPEHIKEGRFGKWLENNVDWAISRERYWGSPLPVWACENASCDHQVCVASIKELNTYARKPIHDDFDLHIPQINEIILKCPKCESDMKREKEVLDCWFNSGVMPWGQVGYPAQKGSEEWYKALYPADFICEGLDQTRGWFYALIALSTLLTGQSSYKNVICTELVLDQEGHKMSKSKGNVVDPMDIFNRYGADPMRWMFINTNPGNSIRFSEEAIKDTIKQIILPVWNIYSFFVTYAKIDGYIYKKNNELPQPTNPLDIWIHSETKALILDVTKSLDRYDPFGAAQTIGQYIDKLSNWYIRRSRRRFWKSENDGDKQEAYDTLYTIFLDFLKVLAPFLPFITEEIYQNLVTTIYKEAPESVHLCDYPTAEEKDRNPTVEHEMNLIRELVSLGRSLRNKHQIKVRQPLREMIVICHDKADQKIVRDMADLIKEELNIKEISFTDNEKDLVTLTVKPNLKKLGPKLGKDLKKVAPLITQLTQEQISSIEADQSITLKYEGGSLDIALDDLLIERKEKEGLLIEVSQILTVALNSEITDDLRKEGFAREFVNKVQNMRKEEGLDVMDKIHVTYHSTDLVKESVETLNDYIKTETLALEIKYMATSLNDSGKTWDLNGEEASIQITKGSGK